MTSHSFCFPSNIFSSGWKFLMLDHSPEIIWSWKIHTPYLYSSRWLILNVKKKKKKSEEEPHTVEIFHVSGLY